MEIKVSDTFFTDIVNSDLYDQSTFGELEECQHECKVAMCYGGHFVNQGGQKAYEIKNRRGYVFVASFIHKANYPDAPSFNFNSGDEKTGLEYGKMMSQFEQREDKDQSFNDWIIPFLTA